MGELDRGTGVHSLSVVASALVASVLPLPLTLAVLSAVPSLRARMVGLLPLAPVSGLVAALVVPDGTVLVAPEILLGLRLEMTGNGALFLGFASFLWISAGFFARAYMNDAEHIGGFCAFWYLTLAGNLGVFIAGDVATFYLSFACVSLAAYPLIVHDRTERAKRAGLVYIVLAIFGETCLLLGFMLAVVGAQSIQITDVRAALAATPWRDLTIALLVVGFGLKAGLVPLHSWLPLAHPAAPTPASAVLSGAIVKAGIFGLIQFLPAGADPGLWSPFLIWAGIGSAWFGILVGLTQPHPKTILAYSTVSQMGLVIAVLGTSLQIGVGMTALTIATLYALHHGLAKGALFMGVGVIQKSGGRAAGAVVATLVALALSVAGLPLMGGALAKLAIKEPLGGGVVELMVILTAVGTGLLLLRFLFAVFGDSKQDAAIRRPMGLVLPLFATAAAALVLPWLLFADLAGHPLAYAFVRGNLWSALWPVLVTAAIAGLALGWKMPRPPAIPEGDLIVPVSAVVTAAGRDLTLLYERLPRPPAVPREPLLRITGSIISAAEARLASWAVAGTILITLALVLMAANALPGAQ
jgi:hydrogenase-4 component B